MKILWSLLKFFNETQEPGKASLGFSLAGTLGFFSLLTALPVVSIMVATLLLVTRVIARIDYAFYGVILVYPLAAISVGVNLIGCAFAVRAAIHSKPLPKREKVLATIGFMTGVGGLYLNLFVLRSLLKLHSKI